MWLNLQKKTVDKRGQTDKKGPGVIPSRGDTRVKSIKNDSDEQKRSSVFREK